VQLSKWQALTGVAWAGYEGVPTTPARAFPVPRWVAPLARYGLAFLVLAIVHAAVSIPTLIIAYGFAESGTIRVAAVLAWAWFFPYMILIVAGVPLGTLDDVLEMPGMAIHSSVWAAVVLAAWVVVCRPPWRLRCGHTTAEQSPPADAA
jgi:hypothetical protein